jgi:hypothetical protein
MSFQFELATHGLAVDVDATGDNNRVEFRGAKSADEIIHYSTLLAVRHIESGDLDEVVEFNNLDKVTAAHLHTMLGAMCPKAKSMWYPKDDAP